MSTGGGVDVPDHIVGSYCVGINIEKRVTSNVGA